MVIEFILVPVRLQFKCVSGVVVCSRLVTFSYYHELVWWICDLFRWIMWSHRRTSFTWSCCHVLTTLDTEVLSSPRRTYALIIT